MTPLLWAIALLVLAMGTFVLELFVPSSGILGLLAAAMTLASVIIVFAYEGFFPGAVFLTVSCVLTSIAVAGMIKWWPYTYVGRRVLNMPPGTEDQIAAIPDYQSMNALVGQHGIADSKMVPSGVIRLNGSSYDAISQGGVIEEGDPVMVVSVDGTRIMVRKADVANVAPDREDSHAGKDSETVSATNEKDPNSCLLYTSPSPRDATLSRMPSSA